MMSIDLKLALFVALVCGMSAGSALWLGLRATLRQQRSPNTALAQVAAELPIGLALLDAHGNVLQTNAAAQRLLPEPASLVAAVTNQGHLTPSSAPASGWIAHPLALRWWRYPLDQQAALVLLLDRSDYQRLASRQQAFIGQLAHELRTPLTSLLAHLAVVRNTATNETIRTTSLATIDHELHRLTRLVRDLLEFHRLEAAGDLALRPTNLLLVAEAAITQVFAHAEQRQIAITLDATPPLPPVLAHADRLTQVFLNLLDNSIKYSRPGDTIIVRLNALPTGVQCAVADNGPGIASADLPYVRQPLYRGQTSVDGSGLGLALVNEILRQHQATFQIESSTEPGQSGTVCSWLLRAAEDTPN